MGQGNKNLKSLRAGVPKLKYSIKTNYSTFSIDNS